MKEQKYSVIAHCADGDVMISENSNALFNYKKAQEIKNAHANLGVDVDIIEIKIYE